MRLTDPYNVAEFRNRAFAIAIIFSVLMSVLVIRLWYLQLWQGDLYRQFSDQNRFKVERLAAPRGQIFDRHGVLLADSRPRFGVSYSRGYAVDLQTEMSILADILKWSEEERASKLKRVQNSGRYRSISLKEDITQDELALLHMSAADLPGLELTVDAVRDYLYKDLFFHSIGYTGEVSDRDLARLQKRFPERNYRLGDQRGIMGIEALYESSLRGRDGRDFVVVDVKGRRVGLDQWALLPETNREDPLAGHQLHLSLDLNLQMVAQEAFKNETGAVVALDPRNGEVLAYVSRPGTDPNIFGGVLKSDEFKRMMTSTEKPFLDRVVGEHYPPGSTLKLFLAAAALENKAIDQNTTYFCPGSFRFGRRVWSCHKKSGHGRVNVSQAIEQSCDVFFYNAGLAMGLDAIYAWATRFGFGRRTFLGSEFLLGPQAEMRRFNSEQRGSIPFEDEVLARGNTTIEAETINAGIGQGAFEVTLMQLARAVAALGNGGKIYQPQLVLKEVWMEPEKVSVYRALVENQIVLSQKASESILEGMDRVINGSEGTARLSRLPKIRWGGKTGTAQVVALDVWKRRAKSQKEFEDHALFVGLAPMDQPQIAVAVIAEHGGHGSGAAAPIAKKIVEAYLTSGPKAEVKSGISAN